jgi:tetratricopeptide (TPR) repeat protein
LQELRGKLRDNEALAIKALIESYDSKQITETMYSASQGQNLMSYAPLLIKYKPLLSFVSSPTAQAEEGATSRPRLIIRLPTYFRQLGHDLAKHIIQTWGFSRQTDETMRDLERLVGIHPEGNLCYLYAAALLVRTHQLNQKESHADAKIGRWTEARRAFLRALDTPSIVPVRALTLDGLIAVELVLGVNEPRDSAMLAQAVQHVRERLTHGPIRAPAVASICFLAALEAKEYDLARLLMADWERLAPHDPALAYRRAQLELRAGAYGPAVKAARQALERDPTNAAVEKLLREANEKLRAEHESLNR